MPEMKGVTVRIPAELHAEVKAYLEAHGMTMGEFITQAVDNELHPKIQITQEEPMERMRTLAFQVPDSLFQRVKAYLERNHMTQKQFVVGLIEAELEQDEAQYQASHPEEQEDEGESDDQTENESQEEAQDEFAAQEAQDGPDAGLEGQPPALEDAAPVDDFEAGSQEVSQEDGGAEEIWEEETQEEETLEEREDAEESNALDDMDDGELEDSLEDEEVHDSEEAWEEYNDQDDSQDEEEEQSYQPSMAW